MQAAIFLFLRQTAAFHLPYSINLSPTWNVLFYHYCMYRRFTDPKFFRRLPYRRIVVYNVIGYGHCPLFDILLQGVPPEYVFYSICKGMREYVWTNFFMLCFSGGPIRRICSRGLSGLFYSLPQILVDPPFNLRRFQIFQQIPFRL